jgi:hypothetical protein
VLDDALLNVPGFVPGVALTAVLALLGRRQVAAWLGVGTANGFLAILAFGGILAATLTPLRELGPPFHHGTGCDFSRVGFATMADILGPGDVGLNVLMFVPLGMVLATLPRTGRTLALIGAAALLPVVIEGLQLVLVPLDRACQSRDVFDNVSGLAVGLVLGFGLVLLRALARAIARRMGRRAS